MEVSLSLSSPLKIQSYRITERFVGHERCFLKTKSQLNEAIWVNSLGTAILLEIQERLYFEIDLRRLEAFKLKVKSLEDF